MQLRINPRRVGWALTWMIGGLGFLSAAGQVARYTIDRGAYRWYVGLFDLNREQNLPTFVQGMLLMACALLLGLIARHKWQQHDGFRRSWTFLAIGFALLSFDEVCSMHEQMLLLASRMGFAAEGFFRFAWVIPGTVIVGVIACLFAHFLTHLEVPTRRRFILGGALYVTGMLGLEMVGGWYSERGGENVLSYQLLTNLEEVMEMAGIAIFLVALLRYMAQHLPGIGLQFLIDPEPAVQPDAASINPLPISRAA